MKIGVPFRSVLFVWLRSRNSAFANGSLGPDWAPPTPSPAAPRGGPASCVSRTPATPPAGPWGRSPSGCWRWVGVKMKPIENWAAGFKFSSPGFQAPSGQALHLKTHTRIAGLFWVLVPPLGCFHLPIRQAFAILGLPCFWGSPVFSPCKPFWKLPCF